MAKTTSRGAEPSVARIGNVSGANSEDPKKIASKETKIAARIKYWAFKANDVLIKAITVKDNKAMVPVILMSLTDIPKPKYALKLSEKPTKYKAIENAVPTARAIPIEPPMGIPILLDST